MSEASVSGRFQLIEKAGEGGMGEVWKARDLAGGRLVALKRILGGGDTARFFREVLLLERIRHPALVAHVAHGEDEGRPYLVMEWVEGESLLGRLGRAPLSLGESLAVARRVADALGALHEQGVVHRDIKPANIMLPGGDAERALLLDLGVARPAHATVALTGANLMVGTLGYMAPEQARDGHLVDARADVFALGCVLFECLTGQPLYSADNPIAALAMLLSQKPRSLRACRPELPEALGALLDQMLALDPAQRLADGATVSRRLAGLGEVAATTSAGRPLQTGALSQSEHRLTLAAIVEVGGVADDATMASAEASASVRQVAAAVKEAGGHFAQLSHTGGLVAIDARGTIADRMRVSAAVLRSVLISVPGARAGLAAGVSATRAGAPAGQVLARAAALAREAAAGAIEVDDTVRELLTDRFEVKGTTGDPAQGASQPTPFVGRDKEMALLDATLTEVIEEQAPRGVLVVAPPGTGKSRLGRELVARLRRRGDVKVLEARADVASAGSLQAMIKALLRATVALGSKPAPGDAARLRAHLGALSSLEHPGRVGDFLCEMLAMPADSPCIELAAARGDAELTSKWTRRSVREWLAAECAAAPLVLVLEDLHWSDELTLEHLADALRSLDGSPLLVVALARPEVRSLLRAPWARTTELTLGELGPRASERLARAALGSEATAERVQRVIERGAGNPLFIEELARFCRDHRDEGLPLTVAAVLHARLEDLAPEQRRMLRAASALGDRFLAEQAGVIADVPPAEVDRVLASLSGKRLVERVEDRWGFHHALVRETVYTTLPEAEARAAHARAADWLEAQENPDPVQVLEQVEKSGDRGRELRWLMAAAEKTAEAGAWNDCRALAARGLTLDPEPAQRGRLWTWSAMGRFWGQGEALQALDEIRRALDVLPLDDPFAPHALAVAAYGAYATGDARTLAQVTDAWLGRAEVPRGRLAAFATFVIVIALSRSGMTTQVERVLARTLPLHTTPAERTWGLISEAIAHLHARGAPGLGRRIALQAAQLATVVGDDHAAGMASFYALAALMLLAPASEELLRRMRQASEAAVNGYTASWLQFFVDTCQFLLDGSTLDRLVAHTRSPDLALAETARVYLITALLPDSSRTNELIAMLEEQPFHTGDMAFFAQAIRTHVCCLRGDFAGAMRLLEALEPGAKGFFAMTVHQTRAQVMLGMERIDEARASMQAALACLADVLEGADDFLLAVSDEGSFHVHAFRAFAAQVGLTVPPLSALARQPRQQERP